MKAQEKDLLYINLAGAIIRQALDDYKSFVIKKKSNRWCCPESSCTEEKLEKFFTSDWCDDLSFGLIKYILREEFGHEYDGYSRHLQNLFAS